MTPEEAKTNVERRLHELGWTTRIGHAGYEKLSRFTAGHDVGIPQLCHKLIALGALQQQQRREITDDVLEMAMLDLSSTEGGVQTPARRGNDRHEGDWSSIEQLAAVLEAKVANGELETELRPPPPRTPSGNGAERAAREAGGAARTAALPKIVLVDPSADARARLVKILSKNFRVIEAADGAEGWRTVLDQADVELVITELVMPSLDGFDLIKRIREASSPPHLVGMPIMVVTGAEHADAKLRVLMTGANDFVMKSTDPLELRSRVLARHKLSKAAADGASPPAPPRTASFDSAAGAVPAKPQARKEQAPAPTAPRSAGKARTAEAAPVSVLTAERRYADAKATRRSAAPKAATPKRVSSTMGITMTATVLLAVVIAAISYVSHETANFASAPAPAVSDPVPAAPPPVTEARTGTAEESETSAGLTPPQDAPSAAASAKEAEPDLVAKAAPAERFPKTPEEDGTDGSKAAPAPVPNAAAGTTAPRPTGDADRGTRTASKPESARPETGTEEQKTVPAPEPTAPAATAQPRSAAPALAAATPALSGHDEAEATMGRQETAAAQPRPAAVPPPAAVPEASPSPPVNRISRDELATFVSRFASVYEAGDLEQFMSLFAENARTNDRDGRNGIRQDYQSLFRTTDLRRMQLGEINWELEGSQAHGWGEFDVTVRRQGDKEPYLYTGSLSFVVEKVGGRLRIVRLYHGQQRVGS